MNQIALATPADIDALLALKELCVKAMLSLGIDQWDEIYPNRDTITHDVQAGTLHILKHAAGTMGCITLDSNEDPLWSVANWEIRERVAVIHRLMIHPGHQGQGWSKRLMTHSESIARDRGFRAIHLDSFTLNPVALRLYDNLGYRRAGIAQMRKGPFICFEKIL